MALTTYAELKTSIADYLHRSDLDDSTISLFVTLGEARLNRKLKLLESESSTTLTAAAGVQFVALPAGWRETIDMYYSDTKERLVPKTIRQINEYRSQGDDPQRPYYASTSGGNINFETVTDQQYTIELDYRVKWDIETDLTNWLLTEAPDAYLYASLLQAKAYTKKPQDLALWAEGLAVTIEELMQQDAGTRSKTTVNVDRALVRTTKFNINRGY